MKNICIEAEDLAAEIIRGFNLELRADVKESQSNCLVSFHGTDATLLRSENGELLDAFEHLLNQILARDSESKIVCDAENFRADREAELRAMAKHAAQQVLKSGLPFVFAPMNARERRIIHLALVDNTDVLTQSTGDGSQRRVRVIKKST
jgi:spoIIIJ-associated protein